MLDTRWLTRLGILGIQGTGTTGEGRYTVDGDILKMDMKQISGAIDLSGRWGELGIGYAADSTWFGHGELSLFDCNPFNIKVKLEKSEDLYLKIPYYQYMRPFPLHLAWESAQTVIQWRPSPWELYASCIAARTPEQTTVDSTVLDSSIGIPLMLAAIVSFEHDGDFIELDFGTAGAYGKIAFTKGSTPAFAVGGMGGWIGVLIGKSVSMKIGYAKVLAAPYDGTFVGDDLMALGSSVIGDYQVKSDVIDIDAAGFLLRWDAKGKLGSIALQGMAGSIINHRGSVRIDKKYEERPYFFLPWIVNTYWKRYWELDWSTLPFALAQISAEGNLFLGESLRISIEVRQWLPIWTTSEGIGLTKRGPIEGFNTSAVYGGLEIQLRATWSFLQER